MRRHEKTAEHIMRTVIRISIRRGWQPHSKFWLNDTINERAAIVATWKRLNEGGLIGIVTEGRDCDGTQYRYEDIIPVPRSVVRWLRDQEKHEQWLDGPESTYFAQPATVTDGLHLSRDLALEAFEDGHPSLLIPRLL